MNTRHLRSLTLISLSAYLLTACSHHDEHESGDHDHSHGHENGEHSHGAHEHHEPAKIGGPNGGRILENVTPKAEFWLRPDQKIQVTFLDSTLTPIPAESQIASLIGGDRSTPISLSFAKEGGALVSEKAFTGANGSPVVLSLQETPSAQPILAKFNLNTANCPSCSYQEYACVCGH